MSDNNNTAAAAASQALKSLKLLEYRFLIFKRIFHRELEKLGGNPMLCESEKKELLYQNHKGFVYSFLDRTEAYYPSRINSQMDILFSQDINLHIHYQTIIREELNRAYSYFVEMAQSYCADGRNRDLSFAVTLWGEIIDSYSEIERKIRNHIPQVLESKKQTKQKTSYVWQNNADKELPELYKLMIDKYRLIAPETTLKQFKAVFIGQPIDDSFEPIRWHQDNASELLYFNEAIKNKVDNVWHIYQRLAACFVKPDGKPFTAAWKSLKTDIERNLSPDKQKAINELVNNF